MSWDEGGSPSTATLGRAFSVSQRAIFKVDKTVRAVAYRPSRHAADIRAIGTLAKLARGFVPWTAASMRPAGVALIANEILLNHRTRILECGSGVSSLLLGSLLDERGGQLISLEHDSRWLEHMRAEVDRWGLDRAVTLVHAPLARHEHQGRWYTRESWVGEVEHQEVDLLVVDGPPADTHRRARYPALPFLQSLLAPDACIVLDDVERLGEQEIVASWSETFPFRFARRFTEGVAVGRGVDAFSV